MSEVSCQKYFLDNVCSNSRLFREQAGRPGQVHALHQRDEDVGPREVCLRADDAAVGQQGRGGQHSQGQVEHRGARHGQAGAEVLPGQALGEGKHGEVRQRLPSCCSISNKTFPTFQNGSCISRRILDILREHRQPDLPAHLGQGEAGGGPGEDQVQDTQAARAHREAGQGPSTCLAPAR